MVQCRRLRKTTIEVQPQSNVDVQREHQILSKEHMEHNTDHLPMQSEHDSRSQPITDTMIHGSPTNSNEHSASMNKRGPTLLSDIFSRPLSERVFVDFNKRG
ncbi:uncharacterized protein LOC119998425 [Tripterygium wilfordii]|uniref:uncharacterized protein LOC119998425 n=1 Tax=Tripterygium wilfordii TaxID=458696 RepID=UPI0018F81E73|nr:uncharacterized protein LOC119998425 [Tripterygium wilfordii]